MNDTSTKAQIELLSNDNWYSWKVQMMTILEARDLWSFVLDGDVDTVTAAFAAIPPGDAVSVKNAKMKDATTRALILSAVDRTCFTIISECKTAVAMWTKLK